MQTTVLDFVRELGYAAGCCGWSESVQRGEEMLGCADVLIVEPPVSGAEALGVIRRMHRLRPTAPIILIKRDGFAVPFSDAMSCGVHAYLRQPLHLAELELMLARLAEAMEPRASVGG